MNFNEIKRMYETCREEESKAIRLHLAQRGFGVSMNSRAGKGLETYTSSGRIKAYDLRNWKWIIASSKNGKELFISLQAFDQDNNSHNHHVLFDRLGIYVYDEKYNAEEAFKKMVTTNIDLPMDASKFSELDALIDTLI